VNATYLIRQVLVV